MIKEEILKTVSTIGTSFGILDIYTIKEVQTTVSARIR